jgi:hypothetical protein
MTNEERKLLLTAPDEAVDELLRQAEECLSGTIQLGLAADQRATTMTGILGAAAVALLAAAAATATGNASLKPLILPFTVSATGLFVAALVCAWSCRPTNFFIGGYEPRLLAQRSDDGQVGLRRHAIVDTQMKIGKNRNSLNTASKAYNISLLIGGISPFLGITIFLFS